MACLNIKDEIFSRDAGFFFKGLQCVMNGIHIGKGIGVKALLFPSFFITLDILIPVKMCPVWGECWTVTRWSSTSDSCGQGRISQGGASPAICTRSPRRLAEGNLGQDGGVSCRAPCAPPPPPAGDRSELEAQEWALLWEGILMDKTGVVFCFVFSTWSVKGVLTGSVLTSVGLSAEVELGEVDGGSELLGVGFLDVLEPRQRRPLRVRHIQVVHGQN